MQTELNLSEAAIMNDVNENGEIEGATISEGVMLCHALGICSSHVHSRACLCSQIVHALLLYMSISSSYSYFLLKSTWYC